MFNYFSKLESYVRFIDYYLSNIWNQTHLLCLKNDRGRQASRPMWHYIWEKKPHPGHNCQSRELQSSFVRTLLTSLTHIFTTNATANQKLLPYEVSMQNKMGSCSDLSQIHWINWQMDTYSHRFAGINHAYQKWQNCICLHMLPRNANFSQKVRV